MSNVEKSFHINMFILKMTGLFPEWTSSIHVWIVYGIFVAPVPILCLVYVIEAKLTDMTKLMEILFVISPVSINVFKVFIFVANRKTIIKVLDTIDSNMFNSHLPQQDHYLIKCNNVNVLISKIYLICTEMSVFVWALRPQFKNFKVLPIDIWFPLDISNDYTYYAVYLGSVLGVIHASITNVAIDTTIAFLIHHAACQIQILKDTMQNLNEIVRAQTKGKINTEENLSKISCEITYRKIGKCVEHYEAIFQFVTTIEKTFGQMLFVQFVASVFVICVAFLRLTQIEHMSVAFIIMVTFLMSMLIQIFVYCYFGTMLYEESNSINQAIYMNTWYEMDLKSKKCLIIFMERCKRPMKVTANKVLDLSLNTFNIILRKSYSLMAVLQNYEA